MYVKNFGAMPVEAATCANAEIHLTRIAQKTVVMVIWGCALHVHQHQVHHTFKLLLPIAQLEVWNPLQARQSAE